MVCEMSSLRVLRMSRIIYMFVKNVMFFIRKILTMNWICLPKKLKNYHKINRFTIYNEKGNVINLEKSE